MKDRNRFFNAKNITIGGEILTILGKIIYNNLKKENGFIKSIVRKILNLDKNVKSDNILDVSDSFKIIETNNNKK